MWLLPTTVTDVPWSVTITAGVTTTAIPTDAGDGSEDDLHGDPEVLTVVPVDLGEDL